MGGKLRKITDPLLTPSRRNSQDFCRKLFFIRRNKCLFATDYRPNLCIPRIIRTLSAHTGVDIVPKDTLIVIDEIQESAAALGCLKYFKEDL